jgi:hypothetical protein
VTQGNGEQTSSRKANAREVSAHDLGPVRLEAKSGYVNLTPVRRTQGDKGFSLLIKETGLYTLEGRVFGARSLSGSMGKNLLIHAELLAGGEPRPTGSAEYTGEDGGKTPDFTVMNLFHARSLPVVFRNHMKADCIIRGGHKRRLSDILITSTRSKYTGVITAYDAEGPAAFIAVGRSDDVKVIGRDGIKGRYAISLSLRV